jgi:two-component system, cell cycle sensor histidine kinase and response regulator CckA
MSNKLALVVDDTPANRDFLERLLIAAHFSVLGADRVKSALDKVKGLATLDLALVDMQLPDMNGLVLAAELRQLFPKAYIVIATMYDDRSLMQNAFSKGCNVFLVKPHGFMELFKRLTTNDIATLRDGPCMLIDQYGPRPFTGALRS